MSSITEELLGFTDLVMLMLTAQQVFFASRDEQDKKRWVKLRNEVEQVAREIHRDHRGVPQGNGINGKMF